MSTIAFDGKIVAADKQGTYCSTIRNTTKLVRLDNGEICGWTGTLAVGETMLDWYKAGADPEKHPPEILDKEANTSFIVIQPSGLVWMYGGFKKQETFTDRFCAWGSGREFAIGAMAAGKNAIDAVAIAMDYDINTGVGITWFKIDGSDSGDMLL